MPSRVRLSTFSVVAADPEAEEWGIAVQSKFVAVGSVVPWAEAGVGAVATQALANVAYGPQGLALLRKGLSAEEVVRKLTLADDQREHRQLGVVDARGKAAAFTGRSCMEWAGHLVGEHYTCQGNILASSEVVAGMARAMDGTKGDLADRLLAALEAGQRAGGDRRGMQGAALYVAKPEGSYGGGYDRYIDVRVDDHPSPIEELKRIFHIYDMTLLNREDPSTLLGIEPQVTREIQEDLKTLGYDPGALRGMWNAQTEAAFERWLGVNNYENKSRKDHRIWPSVRHELGRQAAHARGER